MIGQKDSLIYSMNIMNYLVCAMNLFDICNEPAQQEMELPLLRGDRCSLGFSLLHSSVMCIRGSRSGSKHPCVPPAVDLVVAEGHLHAH